MEEILTLGFLVKLLLALFGSDLRKAVATVAHGVRLFSRHPREAAAHWFTRFRHPNYEPGENLRRDLEWAWTFCSTRAFLGLPPQTH